MHRPCRRPPQDVREEREDGYETFSTRIGFKQVEIIIGKGYSGAHMPTERGFRFLNGALFG